MVQRIEALNKRCEELKESSRQPKVIVLREVDNGENCSLEEDRKNTKYVQISVKEMRKYIGEKGCNGEELNGGKRNKEVLQRGASGIDRKENFDEISKLKFRLQIAENEKAKWKAKYVKQNKVYENQLQNKAKEIDEKEDFDEISKLQFRLQIAENEKAKLKAKFVKQNKIYGSHFQKKAKEICEYKKEKRMVGSVLNEIEKVLSKIGNLIGVEESFCETAKESNSSKANKVLNIAKEVYRAIWEISEKLTRGFERSDSGAKRGFSEKKQGTEKQRKIVMVFSKKSCNIRKLRKVLTAKNKEIKDLRNKIEMGVLVMEEMNEKTELIQREDNILVGELEKYREKQASMQDEIDEWKNNYEKAHYRQMKLEEFLEEDESMIKNRDEIIEQLEMNVLELTQQISLIDNENKIGWINEVTSEYSYPKDESGDSGDAENSGLKDGSDGQHEQSNSQGSIDTDESVGSDKSGETDESDQSLESDELDLSFSSNTSDESDPTDTLAKPTYNFVEPVKSTKTKKLGFFRRLFRKRRNNSITPQ